MPEVDDVENEHQNVLEIVVSHRVISTSRMTLCAGLTLILQLLKGRLCVVSLTTSSTMWMNTCHMQAEQETMTNDSDELRPMSFFPSDFDETDAMFLKFSEALDNPVGRSSSVSDNLGTSQPSTTPTPRRQKPISPYVVRISQVISVCMRKTFSVRYLKWADVGKEYIEVVKADLQQFFVLDFNNQAMNRHFKKYNDPDEARANPPTYWWDVMRIDTTSVTAT
ncbi:CACTA en-spm transposon protein [Cucumis melo var. makuwa]|uniref:CACTA en-spm transposon protein n=1 Tax=Cucumis melo var. makuwa TaxID=1194695 RepID=A0A5D3CY31_CUCMM|nr:CACTA en-spm transposon protein [Cucumis melo var. makuwa]